MIKFEKISLEQYYKDFERYTDYGAGHYHIDIKLPKRATKKSAGYDFFSPYGFCLEPNGTIKIPTGIKASMEDYNMLKIYIRSSLGFKFDVVLANGTGIVDADYYNNSNNEGHIWIKLINHGNETLTINKGEAFAQGIFEDFDLTDDDCSTESRDGGIGSTSKK